MRSSLAVNAKLPGKTPTVQRISQHLPGKTRLVIQRCTQELPKCKWFRSTELPVIIQPTRHGASVTPVAAAAMPVQIQKQRSAADG